MNKITIYPNPFTSRISVEITSEVNEHVIVSITNSEDRILKMFSWHLKPGANTTSIDRLGTLTAGTYYIHIKNSDGLALSKNVLEKEG